MPFGMLSLVVLTLYVTSASCERGGCCGINFYCPSSDRCVEKCKVCDYNADCDEKEDEQSCAETCAVRTTPFNLDGGGNMVYLDRQNVNCGSSGNVITKFHLERAGTKDKVRYSYTCCKLNSDVCTNQKKENAFTIDGGGNTVYLDRQFVDCGNYGFLGQFKLRRDGHGKVRYDYNCCNLTRRKHRDRATCYAAYTPYTIDGRGSMVYLDRQTVQCRASYFLSYFRLVRNSAGTQYRYHYRCCRISV